jgi:hypothetical protein
VEHQLPAGTVVQLGYAGSRGVHLPGRITNINTSIPQTQPDGRLFFPADSNAINPAFGQIGMRYTRFDSIFHGMHAGLQARWRSKLRIQAKFTWAKSIDNCSSAIYNDFQSPDRVPTMFNYRQNRGPSDFDMHRAFAANYSYQLPQIRRSAATHILGGWELHGLVQIQSGPPFNPIVGFDQARLRGGASDLGQRPDFFPSASEPIIGDPQKWFDPLAFSLPAAGFYGNLGRNTLPGPGLSMFTTALHKVVWRTERHAVRLRFEFFNLANHPNFRMPSALALFDSSGRRVGSAGRITETATTSRQIQLALRYSF